MMGRVRTPDGKRNPWSVKLSDSKSAAADRARGEMPRALWLEALIDRALAGGVSVDRHGDHPVPAIVAEAGEAERKPARQRVREPAPVAPEPAPVAPAAASGGNDAVIDDLRGKIAAIEGRPAVAAVFQEPVSRPAHRPNCKCGICQPKTAGR